ncbi:MAG TPA: metallophosphoesterase family protein [Acidobacteriaceae bacterium]|nr:metallophosphoesterase family protein [Acidobacteriaceae bacterium]
MSGSARSLQVGIISDTHGLLRPEAVRQLTGVDHILHAGDVGDGKILDALRDLAPLTAIRGNVDVSGPCAQLPTTEAIELGGCLFYLVHAIDDLDVAPAAAGVKIVVYGHSHRAALKDRDGIIYLNPGSAGPRRFNLPITLARAVVENQRVRVRIINL